MQLLKHRYSAVAIALHWVIALAIIGMIGLGWYMGDLPSSAPNKGSLYQLHKSIGIAILVLTIARILWRMLNKPPEEIPMEHTQAMIAKAVHIAFYALMILMPLTGWVLVSASLKGIPTVIFDTFNWPHIPFLASLTNETKEAIHPFLENAHSKLAWVAIVLLALHIAGALKHQFMDKDDLMARMIPGLFGETDGVRQPSKGVAIAFGGAALFFAGIVGLGMIMTPAAAKPASPPPTSETANLVPVEKTEIAPNWAIDKENSKIEFSFTYDGKQHNLFFEKWDAKIEYNDDAKDKARIEVVVEPASAKTGDKYGDLYLNSAVFFETKKHPTATFSADGVFITEDGLELTAVLNLKGNDYPVRMPFTLTFDADKAEMKSSFTLDRVALDLGTSDPAANKSTSQNVDIKVHVVATKIN